MSLEAQIETLRTELSAAIAGADNEAALDAVRVAALGKKGSVSALLATLGSMAPEDRKSAGPAINGLKNDIAALIEARSEALKGAALEARLKAETVDVTLPLRPAPTARGRIHPISQTIDEITAIFSDMGFSIAEGPDIETDSPRSTSLKAIRRVKCTTPFS
jgi:phenylalanyl-tRNA synthetase alpha chain